MASESITKTIGVVVAICFVAAIFVSSAAVGLKAKQEENKRIDLLKNILIAGIYTYRFVREGPIA